MEESFQWRRNTNRCHNSKNPRQINCRTQLFISEVVDNSIKSSEGERDRMNLILIILCHYLFDCARLFQFYCTARMYVRLVLFCFVLFCFVLFCSVSIDLIHRLCRICAEYTECKECTHGPAIHWS